MLSFPAAVKAYLCTVPCDMRRSFEGLSILAAHLIGCNPDSGHLFVFRKPSTEKTSKVPEQAGLEPSAKSHPSPGGKGARAKRRKPATDGTGRQGIQVPSESKSRTLP